MIALVRNMFWATILDKYLVAPWVDQWDQVHSIVYSISTSVRSTLILNQPVRQQDDYVQTYERYEQRKIINAVRIIECTRY